MPIKIKDHGKCKEWERRRRDRLNDAFKNLAQLLPHYDPAKIPAKIDILEKSTEFVKELRLSNSRLLSNQAETDEKCKLIKGLQDEVNKLILRVKQLTILLKKANITIPTGPEIKSLGSKRHKWSGKLKPEDLENAVTISNGSSKPVEKSSKSPEKANNNGSTMSTASENELTPSAPTVSTLGDPNGVKTINTAISTSVASIIVPLKEANLARSIGCSESSGIAKTSTTQAAKKATITTTCINSKSCQISPTTTTTTTTITKSPSILPSPAKLIPTTSESIFTTATTTPVQLQTFIITSCPLTGTAQATALSTQNPQIFANILPTPILPKSFESLSLQKIPIKSLLKPIPKVIKRRKRKGKNATLSETQTKQKSKCASSAKEIQSKNKVVSTESTNDTSSKKTDTIASLPQRDNAAEKEVPHPTIPTQSPTLDSSPEKAPEEMITTISTEEAKNARSEDTVTSSSVAELLEEQSRKSDDKETPAKESVTHCETEEIKETEPNMSVQEATNLHQPGNETVKTTVKTPLQVDNVIANNSEEKSNLVSSEITETSADNVEVVTEVEEHPTEDIPVLRIVEASSSSAEGPRIDILFSIQTDNSSDKIKRNWQDNATSTETVSKPVPSARTEDETQQSEKMQVDEDIVEIPVVAPSPSPTTNETPQVLPKETESSIPKPVLPTTVQKEVEISQVSQQPNFGRMDDITEQLGGFEQAAASSQSAKVEAPTPAAIEKPTEDCRSESLDETVTAANQTTVEEAVCTESCTTVDDQLADIDAQMKTSMQAQPAEPLAPLENLSAPIPAESSLLTLLDKEKDSGKGKASSRTEPSTRHDKDLMDTASMSTTDKISECIARSIDLIDANDSELMELGEHWEDNGASPKSISPTQIFLNIFPLLPRESSTSEPSQQQSTSIPLMHPSSSTSQQVSKNTLPFLPSSSNSRSSFFIDAMLPDEQSGSGGHAAIVNDSTDLNTLSAHSPFLPLTPPQYSSNIVNQQISNPFSLPNNYYWTPPTVSSSSNNVEITATECRSSSNSIYSQNESHRVTANSSNVGTTATRTFSTPSTKTSTTTTNLLTPLLNPATSASSVVSIKSSSRRSKSTASSSSAGKLAFNFDTNAPLYSKSKPTVTSTSTTKTATPTTISVTWTLTGPTLTQSSTFHPSTGTPFHNTSETNVHFSNSSTSSSQVSHHSCSLLDSLNPMDAAFFRPLINALDSHDFRGLDFSGNNSLAPPPPPLPPLIPPTPSTCKPLYPSQFGPNSQPVQNSVSSNPSFLDHVHATSSTSIQGSFIHHHHHQPVQMFGNNLQSSAAPENIIHTANTNTTSAKHQDNTQTQQQQHVTNISQINQKLHPPASDGAKVTTSAESVKTSRTSGRQKSESAKTKKERSGKSSRTQPYNVASSHSSSTTDSSSNNKLNQGQRFDQLASTATTQKAAHSYPFHTIQSHINPCSTTTTKPTGTLSSRSHDFQMENLHSSLHFETTEFQNFPKSNPSISGSHSSHSHNLERAQGSKTLESKAHKSKEEKLHNYNSSKANRQSVKSSRNNNDFNLHVPSSVSQSLNAVRPISNAPLQTQAKSSNAPSSQTTTIKTSTQQEPVKTTIQNTHTGNAGLAQPFQTPHSALEPFQLFPEFNAGGNSRQFGAPAHSHHFHNHENSTQSIPLQQASSSEHLSSNFNIQPVHQRSHPYYFPDIASSFGENFHAVPVVHQPQPNLSTHQVVNSGNKQSASNSNSSHSIQGLSQGADNSSKFTYLPNNTTNLTQQSQQAPMSQIQPSHQEFHQIHAPVQQPQKASRHHQQSSSFAHHETPPHSCNQQVSVLQLPQTSSTSTSTNQQTANQRHHAHQPCQKNVPQSQNRNQHSHPSTVTTSTTSTAPVVVSSGKGKQQQTAHPPPTSFHAPLATQQQHHHQATSQHHQQQVQLQNTHHHQQQHQQQNVSQPHHHPSRPSSSKTVNWMTDTGYRPSNSTSSTSLAAASNSKHQQRQNSSVSTSNPFSVSKLVGSSTASTPSKVHQSHSNSADAVINTRGQQQLQVQPLSSQNCGPIQNRSNSKSARNVGTANNITTSVTPAGAASNNQSQNQSNYCAEALIRKNPPVPPVDWANEFNLVAPTNQGVQETGGYGIGHHHSSNPHAHHLHHHHHHGPGAEHFPNYTNTPAVSYQYPTGESHVSSSTNSQFTQFDHSQSQYQTAQHHHQQQQQQAPAVQSMSSNNNYNNTTAQGQGRQHNPQSSQNQSSSGQIHYAHQHHYPHHSSHHPHQQQQNHGSTSSVTNFNLSTIFPEINDKRNSNAVGGGHGRTASGNNNSADVSSRGSGSSGNMNSACSYHHSNFGNQPSGNLH